MRMSESKPNAASDAGAKGLFDKLAICGIITMSQVN